VNETPINKKNGFFHSNLFIFFLGQTIAFLCWAIVAAIAWGRLSERLEEGQKWRANAEVQLLKLNSENTNNGYMIMTDRDRLDQYGEHIKYLEEQDRKNYELRLRLEALERASKKE